MQISSWVAALRMKFIQSTNRWGHSSGAIHGHLVPLNSDCSLKSNFTSIMLVLSAGSYFHFLAARTSDSTRTGFPPISLISLTLPSGATVNRTLAVPRMLSLFARSGYSGGGALLSLRVSSAKAIARMAMNPVKSNPSQRQALFSFRILRFFMMQFRKSNLRPQDPAHALRIGQAGEQKQRQSSAL